MLNRQHFFYFPLPLFTWLPLMCYVIDFHTVIIDYIFSYSNRGGHFHNIRWLFSTRSLLLIVKMYVSNYEKKHWISTLRLLVWNTSNNFKLEQSTKNARLLFLSYLNNNHPNNSKIRYIHLHPSSARAKTSYVFCSVKKIQISIYSLLPYLNSIIPMKNWLVLINQAKSFFPLLDWSRHQSVR